MIKFSLKLISTGKYSILMLAICSSFYAISLVMVGKGVESGLVGSGLPTISISALLVLLLRFMVNLSSDYIAIHWRGKAQQEILPEIAKNMVNLHASHNSSELLHRLTEDYTQYIESFIQGVLQIISYGLVTLALSVYMLQTYSQALPQVTLILCCAIAVTYFLNLLLNKLANRKAQLDAAVFRFQRNYIQGLEHLQISQRLQQWRIRFTNLIHKQMTSEKKISLLQHSTGSLKWGLRYVFVLLVISPILLDKTFSATSAYWLFVIVGLFSQILWSFYHFGQVKAYIDRALILIQSHNTLLDSNKTNECKDFYKTDQLELVAKELNIFFGNTQQLSGPQQLDFHYKKGDRVWINGASGTGKTTLLRCLLELHPNYTGTITMPTESLKVGYLSQDPFFFDGESVAENLNVASVDDSFKYYADQLGLNSFFDSIQWDLSACLGSEGISPSRGQKTRLGILREIIKQPQIFLLDEPSSNVDTTTRQKIFKLLYENSAHCITLVCEHSEDLKDSFMPNKHLHLGINELSINTDILLEPGESQKYVRT